MVGWLLKFANRFNQMHSNLGYIITLALNLSLLLPLTNDTKVNNYVVVLTNSYWVLTGVWWCKASPDSDTSLERSAEDSF